MILDRGCFVSPFLQNVCQNCKNRPTSFCDYFEFCVGKAVNCNVIYLKSQSFSSKIVKKCLYFYPATGFPLQLYKRFPCAENEIIDLGCLTLSQMHKIIVFLNDVYQFFKEEAQISNCWKYNSVSPDYMHIQL